MTGEVSAERAQSLRRRFLDAGTDVPVHVQADAAWMRISAAAYNELDDYAKLAGIAAKVIAQE